MPRTPEEELLWQIFAPEEAKKRLKAWKELPEQPELIRSMHLTPGMKFKELSDSKKDKPATVKTSPEQCKTEYANVHVKTSRGDWCIAKEQFLVVA